MRTQYHGRDIFTAACCEPILDAGYDSLLHPGYIVFNCCHRLAQTYQQSYIGILLDEGGNALTGIVGDKWGDGTMPILSLQTVMIGKGLAQDDVIEHLYHPDSTTVSLMGQEREDLFVFLEGLFIHF